MSYCRWSSDDFQCDLYCYESDEGFQTHVACRRIVGKIPPSLPFPKKGKKSKEFKAYFRRELKQMKWLKTARHRKIGLPYDGESFDDPDLQSFLARLVMLRKAGYRFPDYVFAEVCDELFTPDNPVDILAAQCDIAGCKAPKEHSYRLPDGNLIHVCDNHRDELQDPKDGELLWKKVVRKPEAVAREKSRDKKGVLPNDWVDLVYGAKKPKK